MQRIANLLIYKDGQVLLLKKPRRNWYVAPGGKMEVGESILNSAIREFTEETNTIPINPHLKGIYTMVIEENGIQIDEWMLFTFVATNIEGTPFEETTEGILEWHAVEDLYVLPMAEGDRTNLLFAVREQGIQYGTFVYTPDFTLIKETIQQSVEGEVDNGKSAKA
ncbi:8-oxo-dGTP diphosphatase [Psychrobacillus glaciei]|uniref:8-oxo-dGTP diphosphatase n=1 Tax=Psychrobacillus glaciei TaxID=2283160 RepID=A0A5J6SPR9_9BACI|nr:8-oxo-dGTP diphosphatase [Psychrobacillus glaciei]QFF99978.1 8-oxo-dGTP diphosphatase [Psychrobacillus glaciei]